MPDPSDGAGESRRYQLRPRRRFARRWLLRSIVVLAVLGMLHRWWGDRAEVRFEREVAALAAAGAPVSLAELAAPPVPDEVNGSLALRLAAALAAPDGESADPQWASFLTHPPAAPLTPDERRTIGRLVRAHADALDAAGAARIKGGVDWQIPLRSPEWVDQSYRLEGLGDLLTLLGYAALYEHDRGSDALAVGHARSMLFVGRSLTARPFLFSQTSGNAVSVRAARRVADLVPDLNIGAEPDRGAVTPEEVRDLVRELLDEGPWRDGMRRALRGEQTRIIQSVRGLSQGRATLAELCPGFEARSGDNPIDRKLNAAVSASFGRVFRPWVFDDGIASVRHLEVVIEQFDASPEWPTAVRRVPRLPPGMDGQLTGVTHVTAFNLLHPYTWDFNAYYQALAERRLAATALAVRWYACEHGGVLPARLGDLVPRYLPALPSDPLAEGGPPLGYVAESKRPVVYSVGENGKDDGGREYDPAAPMPRRWKTDEVRHLRRGPRRVLQWVTVQPSAATPGR